MDWPVLVLVGILVALGAMAAWGWVRRREAIDAATGTPPPVEPVAVPVVEPVAVPVVEAVAVPVVEAVAVPVVEPDRPATTPRPPDRSGIVRSDDPAQPHGPGSAAPGADGSGPDGWTVKGNADSGLYHTPSSPSWKRLQAEAWFESEQAAEAAGFRRWDWRRTGS